MRCCRIRFSDLAVCEIGNNTCRKSTEKFPSATKIARLFRKNGNLKLIRDGDFLIGEICDGKARGKRIDVLPDGEKLDKGFSLFAPGLMIHDERSRGHWDVIFRNDNGSFCYIYSLKKVRDSKKRKFRLVDTFEKCLPRLKRNLLREISGERKVLNGHDSGEPAEGGRRNGDLVLAMLVLLKMKMRVGSEIYYKRNHHKGLTTLKKKNVKISGTRVTFSFIGKDGVPQVLSENFNVRIAGELKKVLKKRKLDDFVFLNSKGRVFSDVEFEAGFEKFCGERFYPHIVRSHFATREVEAFLRKVDNREWTVDDKKKVRKFCLGLAGKLGHKKFSKKDGVWEDSYEVTLHHYVRPDLVERIRKLI